MAEIFTTIASMVDNAMQQKGLTIRDLSEELDLSSEHTRRIVRGEATPSKFVLKPLCNILGLDYAKAEQIATGERIRKKYGVAADSLSPRVEGIENVEKVWGKLSKSQQDDALAMMEGWAKNNTHAKASK